MKPYRKGKICKREFDLIREIGYNYHKFIYKISKKRIRTKRLFK